MSGILQRKIGNLHLGGGLLLLLTALAALLLWTAVQAQRQEPLPTLVWAPTLTDTALITISPIVLDRLGNGWWWIYGTPDDRQALRAAGAYVAIAMPTPIAQMAGCSIPPLPTQIRP